MGLQSLLILLKKRKGAYHTSGEDSLNAGAWRAEHRAMKCVMHFLRCRVWAQHTRFWPRNAAVKLSGQNNVANKIADEYYACVLKNQGRVIKAESICLEVINYKC